MVNKGKLYIHFLLLLTSCIFIFGEEYDLTFEREAYQGSSLKLDGFYQSVEQYKENDPKVIFLFRDGTILSLGVVSADQIPRLENETFNSALIENVRNSKLHWGLFKVDDDSIKYELRYPSGHELVPYISMGKITSDTTFEIREWMRYDGTEREPHHLNYRFKKFHPKPDSTNEFLKE